MWFEVKKQSRDSTNIFENLECQFAIHNGRGDALMLLQECFNLLVRKYHVFKLLSPTERFATSKPTVMQVCSAERLVLFGTSCYDIKMTTPTDHGIQESGRVPPSQCSVG